jgi:ADP-ribose pyrophosphatase YjhB (NUDIX family)
VIKCIKLKVKGIDMTDITLEADNGFFIYKVGAIIIKDNKVLMIKNDSFKYFYPVGGRVRFGETSETTVLRETFEETGIHFEIDRLAFIHENFFVADFLDNAPCHEIALYYLMKPSDDIDNAKCDSYVLNGVKEHLHWLPITDLTEHDLFPEFYKTELRSIQDEIKHFVTKDNKTWQVE